MYYVTSTMKKVTIKINLPKPRNIRYVTFADLALIAAIILLTIGAGSLVASKFTGTMVKTELVAQKIYFPQKGSPDFEPSIYPELQKYAGQQVDTPQKAKAFANGFIGRHLKQIADGKVYAEVSAELADNPTNNELRQQKQLLFQGETLRGMLLTSGYGFGLIGAIAFGISIVTLAGGTAMLFLALYLKRNFRNST